MPLRQLPAWDFVPLLRRLAGRDSRPALPDNMEDWQLRDLALTRPCAGPCRPLFFELP
jgi:hypothetical protein